MADKNVVLKEPTTGDIVSITINNGSIVRVNAVVTLDYGGITKEEHVGADFGNLPQAAQDAITTLMNELITAMKSKLGGF